MNKARCEFISKSINEGFARNVAAAFLLQFDPTVDFMADVKTAVSEAVTNAIVHGYKEKQGDVILELSETDGIFTVAVEDYGCGIEDVEKAMQPLYTTNADEERSGMGFTVMETFMDSVEAKSLPTVGTKVIMKKTIGCAEAGVKCG